MNRLRGVNGSTIIDDSYNASPMAIAAALKIASIRSEAPCQRDCDIGLTNEFGELSPRAHQAVGITVTLSGSNGL